jgi:hypothetical protein
MTSEQDLFRGPVISHPSWRRRSTTLVDFSLEHIKHVRYTLKRAKLTIALTNLGEGDFTADLK